MGDKLVDMGTTLFWLLDLMLDLGDTLFWLVWPNARYGRYLVLAGMADTGRGWKEWAWSESPPPIQPLPPLSLIKKTW